MNSQFLRTVTVLPVDDIGVAAKWYKHALGLNTAYLHEGEDDTEATNYAILARDGVEVHLILDEPPPHRTAWSHAGTGYLYLLVRDVDAVFEEVRSRGFPIARALRTEGWGARAFELTDPAGNSVHIEQAR